MDDEILANRSRRRFSFRRPPQNEGPSLHSSSPQIKDDFSFPPRHNSSSPPRADSTEGREPQKNYSNQPLRSRKGAERHKHIADIPTKIQRKKKRAEESEDAKRKKRNQKGKTRQDDDSQSRQARKSKKKRSSSRKRSLALDRAQDKMVTQMLNPHSKPSANQNVMSQMTTGQMALMEKKQKLYKETQSLPLWGIRKVVINPIDKDDLNRFAENAAISSKYTWYSFLFKNLIEQFHRVANLWFLFVSILQAALSTEVGITAWATAAPLILLLAITGAKDAFEDLRRHRNDWGQDSRRTRIVDPNPPHDVVNSSWRNVRVGNVLQLYEDEEVPADLIVLSSSNVDGIAYADTIDLDGEADLKMKVAVKETKAEVTYSAIGAVRGRVVCEQPTIVLDSFSGSLKLDAHPRATPLDASNFILKGSKIRNTDFLFGVVVYTGKDTRLNCNTLGPRLRRSVIDVDINHYILFLMGVILFLVIVAVLISNSLWRSLFNDNLQSTYAQSGADMKESLLQQSVTFVILFNNLIPISLMVTIDVVRFIQGLIIERDPRMQQMKNGVMVTTQARSANLNETLGMVDFVFADKTGTVTQNNMTFKMCVIGGRVYGLPTRPERQKGSFSRSEERSHPEAPHDDVLEKRESGDESHSTDADFFGSHSSFTVSSDENESDDEAYLMDDEVEEEEEVQSAYGSISERLKSFGTRSFGTQSNGTRSENTLDILEEDRSQLLDGDGSQLLEGDGSQLLDGDGSQLLEGDGSQTLVEAGDEQKIPESEESPEQRRGRILKQVTFREKTEMSNPKSRRVKSRKRSSHRHRTRQRRPSVSYLRQQTITSVRSSTHDFRPEPSIGAPYSFDDHCNSSDDNHPMEEDFQIRHKLSSRVLASHSNLLKSRSNDSHSSDLSNSHLSTSRLSGSRPSDDILNSSNLSPHSTPPSTPDSPSSTFPSAPPLQSSFHSPSINHFMPPPFSSGRKLRNIPSSQLRMSEDKLPVDQRTNRVSDHLSSSRDQETVPAMAYEDLFVANPDSSDQEKGPFGVKGPGKRPTGVSREELWAEDASLPDLSPEESYSEGSERSYMEEHEVTSEDGLEGTLGSSGEESSDDLRHDSNLIDEEGELEEAPLPKGFKPSRKEIDGRCHFKDKTIFDDLHRGTWRSRKIDEFIKVMALCNTVIPYVALAYESMPEGMKPTSDPKLSGRHRKNGSTNRNSSDHGTPMSGQASGTTATTTGSSWKSSGRLVLLEVEQREGFHHGVVGTPMQDQTRTETALLDKKNPTATAGIGYFRCCRRRVKKEHIPDEESGRSTEASIDPLKNYEHDRFQIPEQPAIKQDATPQSEGWVLQPSAAAVVQRRASVSIPSGPIDVTPALNPAMATSIALLRGTPRLTGHKMVRPPEDAIVPEVPLPTDDASASANESHLQRRRGSPFRGISIGTKSALSSVGVNMSQLDTMQSTHAEDSGKYKTLLYAKVKVGRGNESKGGSNGNKESGPSPPQRVFNFYRHSFWDGTFRDSILYQAYSPDEECLVSAASHLGYTLVSKTANHAFLEIGGVLRRYEILGVNGWTHQRKRMSVVLREEGSSNSVLYCKGADESVLDILDEDLQDMAQLRRHISRFSLRGLRSLVLCCRYLSPRETAAFRRLYSDAKQSIYNKDERAEKVALEFEQNLELLGITGVRDKLQAGVPEMVDLILESGARIWLLTGDHPDYTVHVGYSAKLIRAGTVVFNADFVFPSGVSVRGSRAKKEGFALFERYKKLRLSAAANEGLCVVITGRSLPVFLSHQELQSLFLLMTCSSDAVLCTRITPAQKAQLVQIMKKRLTPSPVILAVGDGANDVSMLQASHCGIAIMGSEGMEAVAASDFALPSFAFLKPLLFIHGRLNYLRMSTVILWFFFKSFLLVLPLFFFTPLNHWTGASLYDSILYMSYNLLFTSLPIVVTGALEWDIPERVCTHVPILYALGRRRLYFNGWMVVLWFIEALCWAAVLFYFQFGILRMSILDSSGTTLDVEMFGFIILSVATLSANFKLFLECRSYSKIWIWLFVITVLLYFPFTLARGNIPWPDELLLGAPEKALGSPVFWFSLGLSFGTSWLIHVFFRYLKTQFFCDLSTEVAEFTRSMERQKLKDEAAAGRRWKPDPYKLDPEIADKLAHMYHPFTAPGIGNELPKPRHFQLTDNVLAYAPFLTAPGAPPKPSIASVTAAEAAAPFGAAPKPKTTPRLGDRVRGAAARLSISIGLYSPRTQTGYTNQFVDPLGLPGEGDLVKDEEVSLASSSESESDVGGQVGRSTGRLKVVKVSDLIRRFSLKFKDHQLEAEFQFMRRREYKKYSTWYRVVLFALLITMLFQLSAGLYNKNRIETVPKFVNIISGALAIFICCVWNFFDSFYTRLETIILSLLSVLLLTFPLSAFDHDITLALPCIFGTLTFVILRIPFTKAVFINVSFFIAFILAYTIYGASNSFLFLSLPHFMGIEGFTGFAGYRLEYNQRKRFLLNYQVEVARRKQREILNTMLPSFVVEKMLNATMTKDGIPVDLRAEDRGTVTVLFCDVYEFQNLVSSVEPTRLVEVLDSLFLCFDKCAEQFGCTKIETVFETYLCAAGLRPGEEGGSENPVKDAFDALDMALAMLEFASYIRYEIAAPIAVNGEPDEDHNEGNGGDSGRLSSPLSFNLEDNKQRSTNDETGVIVARNSLGLKASQKMLRGFESPIPQHETRHIRVKIGIHSGRVISGVVGAKKPQYALFGDTVNTASRMKMTGEPDHLHMSEASFYLVKDDVSLTWEERQLQVKGKGTMNTYLLTRVKMSNYPLFSSNSNEQIPDDLHLDDDLPLRDPITHPRRVEANRARSADANAEQSKTSMPEQFRSLVYHAAPPPISRSEYEEQTSYDFQTSHRYSPSDTAEFHCSSSHETLDQMKIIQPSLLQFNDFSESLQISDSPISEHVQLDVENVQSDVSLNLSHILDQCDEPHFTSFHRSQLHSAESNPPSRNPSGPGENPLEGSYRKRRIQSALSTVQRSMRRVSVFQTAGSKEGDSVAAPSALDLDASHISSKDSRTAKSTKSQEEPSTINVSKVDPITAKSEPGVGAWPLRWMGDSKKSGVSRTLRRVVQGEAGPGAVVDIGKGVVDTVTTNTIPEDGDAVEELSFEQRASKLKLYLFTLSFRVREQEEEYKQFFYNDKSNINTIEQSLIIFLVTFVLYTIMEIIFDGQRTVEDSGETFKLRNLDQYWSVRAAYTTVWFTCWILFHYRTRPEIQTLIGVRWMTFFLNVTFISAACIFLISPAWAFEFSSGQLKWLETDCFQLVFFITVIHHYSGLLFQHVILVNFLILAMVFVFVQIVCGQTRAAVYTLFLIFPFLFFNSLSAHHKENIDRLTWYVSEEMQTTEDRARELLNDMLPKQVLEEFQQDKLKLAYRHDRMTFLFADICGFTTYANSVDATEVVQMLQQLFARFDRDSTRFGLYKLCTIGDAYVAVSEPVTEDNPDWNPVEGAERVLEMANAMIDKIREVRERLAIPGLNMRIGLHYGKCVGGVIGSGRLRYDLWGLDVLTGNMMESNGMPGKINVSVVLKNFLEEQFPGRFRFKFNRAVKVIDQVVDSYLLQDGADEEAEKILQPETRAIGRKIKRRFSVLGMQFGGKKDDDRVEQPEEPTQRIGSIPPRGAVRRGSIARLFGRKEESPLPLEGSGSRMNSPRSPPASKQQGPLTLEKLREMFQDIDLAEHGHDDNNQTEGTEGTEGPSRLMHSSAETQQDSFTAVQMSNVPSRETEHSYASK